MKKRVLFLLIPILIMAIGVGIYFLENRQLVYDVTAKSWDKSDEFYLGTFEVSSCDDGYFIPENNENFISQVENNSTYIGMMNSFYNGNDEYCHMFCYNDGIYMLMSWNSTNYKLLPCATVFRTSGLDYNKYSYPSPGEYKPDGEKCIDTSNYTEFDYLFGDFDYVYNNFYGRLSDKIVDLNPEEQLIKCHPYCYDTNEIDQEKWVVIDFINKTVTFDWGEE